jgi:hypothetical protein
VHGLLPASLCLFTFISATNQESRTKNQKSREKNKEMERENNYLFWILEKFNGWAEESPI